MSGFAISVTASGKKQVLSDFAQPRIAQAAIHCLGFTVAG